MIRGGSPEARDPLAPGMPRRYSARVVSEDVDYVAIDSDLLDMMITWDQTGTYEVGELRGVSEEGPSSDDWMTNAAADQGVPLAFRRRTSRRSSCACSASTTSAGEVVIKQGDEGDYFYAIVKGRCAGHARDAAQQGRHQARRARQSATRSARKR